MSTVENELGREVSAFVARAVEEADLAFRVFRETGTTTANGTVGFVERIPGTEKLVTINYAGPFSRERVSPPTFSDIAAAGRYNKIFAQHADITTVSHVHAPYLGAWAQTHRTLPIHYVPVQRFLLTRELPIYIDRRQPEQDFILDRLKLDPHATAVLEANGGATVWGRNGLLKTADFIVILEEGARLQALAESIGGSRAFGPGVLAQQYRMSGLTEKARELGLLPAGAN